MSVVIFVHIFSFLSYLNHGYAFLFHEKSNNSQQLLLSSGSGNSDTAVLHNLLSNQMVELDKSVRSLIAQVTSVEKDQSFVNNRCIKMEQELQSFKTKFNELESENMAMAMTLKELNRTFSHLEIELASQNRLNSDLKEELFLLQNRTANQFSSTNETITQDRENLQRTVTTFESLLQGMDRNISGIIDNYTNLSQNLLDIQNGYNGNFTLIQKELATIMTQNRYMTLSLLDTERKTKNINVSFHSFVGEQRQKEDHLEKNLTRLQLEIERSNTTTHLIQHQTTELNMSQQSILSNLNQTIAFTAYVDGDPRPDNGKSVVFPSVYSNIGSAYNNTNGIFTAPVAGVYVFFFGMECYPYGRVYADLLSNETKISHTHCGGGNQTDFGSGMSIVNLAADTHVWVNLTDHNPQKPIGGKSTFSGFLLRLN